MKIFKYLLKNETHQEIEVPAFAQILTVQVQGDQLCLWALVNPDLHSKSKLSIGIYGTGHALPDRPGAYISTVQMLGGDLVFHIFNEGVIL